MSGRRLMVSVVGDARLEVGDPRVGWAREVGALLVERGARVVTGGLGGVMSEALRGARESLHHFDGAAIAVLPGHDPSEANEWADIVLPTGLGIARNFLVAQTDAVIVIGGGAGTLSEIAIAWQLRRPVVALGGLGWAGRVAGTPIDHRDRKAEVALDCVHAAASPREAVELAVSLAPRHRRVGGPASRTR